MSEQCLLFCRIEQEIVKGKVIPYPFILSEACNRDRLARIEREKIAREEAYASMKGKRLGEISD